MSFNLTHTYDGRTLPLDMIYIDAYAGTATVANVTVSATDARETLDVNAPVTATFDGHAFPLAGSDYLTPVTGSLTIEIDTTGLAAGMTTLPLFTTTGRWQGLGRLMLAFAGFGIGGRVRRATLPLIYISAYALTAATSSPSIVPTSAWQ